MTKIKSRKEPPKDKQDRTLPVIHNSGRWPFPSNNYPVQPKKDPDSPDEEVMRKTTQGVADHNWIEFEWDLDATGIVINDELQSKL